MAEYISDASLQGLLIHSSLLHILSDGRHNVGEISQKYQQCASIDGIVVPDAYGNRILIEIAELLHVRREDCQLIQQTFDFTIKEQSTDGRENLQFSFALVNDTNLVPLLR